MVDRVDKLIQHLSHPDIRVRVVAALILGRIGAACQAAVPALAAALQDQDKQVRNAADWAMEQISPPTLEPGKLFVRLIELLEKSDLSAREFAKAVLRELCRTD